MNIQGYAEAIVKIAEAEDALETVEKELFVVARALEEHGDLTDKLTDVQVPIGSRLTVLESQALAAAHPATRSALAAVIASGRAGDLREIATEVARRAAAARERELVEVYVAVELDPAQVDALREALERSTGKRLDLKVFVDPDVIGGVRAKIGDTVIDGSVAKRLNDVRARLAG